MPRDVVVVCTRNRPELVARTTRALRDEFGFDRIVVVDGSDEEPRTLVRGLLADRAGVELVLTTPGLAHQRNVGVRAALEDPETQFVWWFDDDGDVLPGYRARIEQVFAADREERVGGAGGRALDERARPTGRVAAARNAVKRLFLLHGAEGTILASGRNIQMATPGVARDVDWLQGGASTYRRAVHEAFAFDDRLVGYCWGEDFDFSHRVGRRWRLVGVPDAAIVNHEHGDGRWSAADGATTRTVLLHAWVREQPEMSTTAYWWSLVGEMAYVAALTFVGARPDGLRELRGLVAGALVIMRGGSSRSFAVTT